MTDVQDIYESLIDYNELIQLESIDYELNIESEEQDNE